METLDTPTAKMKSGTAEALIPVEVSEEVALLREICTRLDEQNRGVKKQLSLTRVCMIAVSIIALLAIVCMAVILPPMTRAIETVNQSVSTLDMNVVSETISEIQTVAKESNLVVAEAGTALNKINALDFDTLNQAIAELESAVANFSKLDIDALNTAIKDLGDTIEPLATVVNNMKKLFG